MPARHPLAVAAAEDRVDPSPTPACGVCAAAEGLAWVGALCDWRCGGHVPPLALRLNVLAAIADDAGWLRGYPRCDRCQSWSCGHDGTEPTPQTVPSEDRPAAEPPPASAGDGEEAKEPAPNLAPLRPIARRGPVPVCFLCRSRNGLLLYSPTICRFHCEGHQPPTIAELNARGERWDHFTAEFKGRRLLVTYEGTTELGRSQQRRT